MDRSVPEQLPRRAYKGEETRRIVPDDDTLKRTVQVKHTSGLFYSEVTRPSNDSRPGSEEPHFVPQLNMTDNPEYEIMQPSEPMSPTSGTYADPADTIHPADEPLSPWRRQPSQGNSVEPQKANISSYRKGQENPYDTPKRRSQQLREQQQAQHIPQINVQEPRQSNTASSRIYHTNPSQQAPIHYVEPGGTGPKHSLASLARMPTSVSVYDGVSRTNFQMPAQPNHPANGSQGRYIIDPNTGLAYYMQPQQRTQAPRAMPGYGYVQQPTSSQNTRARVPAQCTFDKCGKAWKDVYYY
eukprot:m.341258 g.341258  ORF g.341258 m.341258 type:complete len:298 (+) comp19960_c0_seq1:109-1002(+)